MKKLFIVLAAGLVMAACNDNSTNDTGTGGSIDSNYSAPPDAASDNTNVHPDSIRTDSSNMSPQGGDGNPSAGKEGTSSGQSGQSTNSNNSGSAKDDTNGSK